jgi:transposase-like protein
MAEVDTIVGLARELGVSRKQLCHWRDRFQGGGRLGLKRQRGRAVRKQIAAPCLRNRVVPSILGKVLLNL